MLINVLEIVLHLTEIKIFCLATYTKIRYFSNVLLQFNVILCILIVFIFLRISRN